MKYSVDELKGCQVKTSSLGRPDKKVYRSNPTQSSRTNLKCWVAKITDKNKIHVTSNYLTMKTNGFGPPPLPRRILFVGFSCLVGKSPWVPTTVTKVEWRSKSCGLLFVGPEPEIFSYLIYSTFSNFSFFGSLYIHLLIYLGKFSCFSFSLFRRLP